MNRTSIIAAGRLCGALAWALLVATARGGSAETNSFGFTGPEIYPLENAVTLLHAADMDGDGLNDLIVVNNARAKINLLYNRTGKTNIPPADDGLKKEINQLPPDARFRITSIASEKRISSLVVADLNGDGLPDLAYYGDPKELVVLFNLGTNGWSAPKRFAIEDGQLGADALTTGDLHGSGRPGLVLLGENNLYYIAQNADHLLAEPEKIPFSGSVKSLQVLDINGDGRDDLLLINGDSPDPFRFRLQDAQGQLGPEVHFTFPPVRSYLADDLLRDHKMELITIAQNSGRAQISGLNRKPAEPLSGDFKNGQFQVLPLKKTTQSRRGILWADVNGDGLSDLLVAEPASGQLTLYLQQAGGTLGSAKTFPTLSGVTELAVSDWNQDGAPEIFVLSSEEHQIGVTKLDTNGRIAFPAILPFEGRPLAMAVGPLRPGAAPTLAVILDQDGKRALATRTADGNLRAQALSTQFKANPASMTMFDANQDGLADLVVLIPYEKIKVLIQTTNNTFDEEDVLPPGGNSDQPWLSTADVDGDGRQELLLAQKNFIRAVVLQPESPNPTNDAKPVWTFHVKDQINGASSSSRIVGAAPLCNGSNAVPSMFLLDSEQKALTLCERDAAGVWQVVRNLSLPVSDFSRLQAVSLGATNANSLAFLGVNAVGTMALRGEVWELAELDSYETSIPDGHLTDVVTGDLNHAGRKDLVFLETAKNYLDLVSFVPPHKLVPGNRWQVFEERTFRSRRNDDLEPREALVADVTGRGKNDLIVLVHDRILVYPQE
ncbi:MAG TPA: VCBS repeat-containing protein [Candidatus Acidoferrum sp.]|nr:VCBS repeat-containing protein [Candidatus Acidoferrum sp.]